MKTMKFLSKESQNELKNRYHASLLEVGLNGRPIWDEKMAEFCTKQNALFVPICGGKFIIGIEKAEIRKDFWFGYSSCGQGPEWDECMNSVRACSNNLEKHFLNENLAPLDSRINELKMMIKNNNVVLDSVKCPWVAYRGPHYYSEPVENPVQSISFIHFSREEMDVNYTRSTKMEVNDLKNYLAAMIEYRAMFEKKLNTYLKKYGTKKLRVDSYWIDR